MTPRPEFLSALADSAISNGAVILYAGLGRRRPRHLTDDAPIVWIYDPHPPDLVDDVRMYAFHRLALLMGERHTVGRHSKP